MPPLPRQHTAAIGCTKNYQPIWVTVHLHCVESFEGLSQRCRRGRGCSELWKNTIFLEHPVGTYVKVNSNNTQTKFNAYKIEKWMLCEEKCYNQLESEERKEERGRLIKKCPITKNRFYGSPIRSIIQIRLKILIKMPMELII